MSDYESPEHVGSLGGVQPYAKAQKISLSQAKKELEKNLAYTLHKPRRRRGAFVPVIVFDIDEQWVADLIEVQTIAKENKGNRQILVVHLQKRFKVIGDIMRGGSLRRFQVYVPGDQKGGSLHPWPSHLPPFYGSWGTQVGAGIKDMVKDVARGTGRGLKRTFSRRSLSEFPRGVKREVKRAVKHEVQRRVTRKLNDIFDD